LEWAVALFWIWVSDSKGIQGSLISNKMQVLLLLDGRLNPSPWVQEKLVAMAP
jgi:hypothetical protein